MTEPMAPEEYAKLLTDLEHGAPTPGLETWLRAEATDPNFRWRIPQGHIHNALDMALEAAEARTADLRLATETNLQLQGRLRNHEVLKEEMKWAIPAVDHWRDMALSGVRGAYEALADQAEAGKLPPVRVDVEDGAPARVHVSEWLRRIAKEIPHA